MTLSVMEYCQHSPSTPSSAHNSAAITPAPTPTAIFHCPADAVGAAPVDCDVVGDVVTPERDCPASEGVVAVVCDGGGTVSVWVVALDAPPAVLLLSEIGGTVSVCVDTLDALLAALLLSEIGGMEKALEVVETGGPGALVVLDTITVELSERGVLSERGTVSDEVVALLMRNQLRKPVNEVSIAIAYLDAANSGTVREADAVLGGTESAIDEVLKLDVSACGAAAARLLASAIVHERAVIQRMVWGPEVTYYSD